MLKILLQRAKEFQNVLQDERQRKDLLLRTLTSKKLITFGIVSNFAGVLFYMVKLNDNNVDRSLSRFVSRQAGRIGNLTIPTFLRPTVYKAYMKMYNVNREEILDQNLKNYNNIKDFFIRHIDVRYIKHL